MMTQRPLKYDEYRPFMNLLNEEGYVLDFSTADFDRFTFSIVGIELTQQFNCSKGKSLQAYVESADRSDSIRLLRALMKEWERARRANASQTSLNLAELCYKNLDEISAQNNAKGIDERLTVTGFTSDYLTEQRALLWEKAKTHPTATIGIAKELIESCCKTILEEHQVHYSKDDHLQKLVDKAQTTLGINPREMNEDIPAYKTVKALLGSLASVVRYLTELRNNYGIGHGKAASYTGLSERHANLAAGASLTVVDYLWATHRERNPHGR
ncbi:abortive infection family protein [uncultured Corynebacterium sp.]|uniref:abortive infection family protein n=1 Tax=uncultured Corynebacterium sp. TaxID=159447 RepID=UPI0025ED9295|nr:abortive infection family protein [uncultured Corynebacterium sp.]